MMHTKEPWVATNIPMSGRIVCVVPHEDSQANDWFILVPGKRGSTEDDARRIVACVNACQGIANPKAVGNVVEALRWLVNLHMGVSKGGGGDIGDAEWQDAIDEGIAALAALEAGE